MTTNLFDGAAIRSAWVGPTNKHWFSAVDVCAAILQCDYQKGRNYWKWLKHKMDKRFRKTVRFTNRLKMQAADGKKRFTDVLDTDGVLRLILLFPSPKAMELKLWVAKLSENDAAVKTGLTNAVKSAKDTVRSGIAAVFESVRYKDFDLFNEGGFKTAKECKRINSFFAVKPESAFLCTFMC